MREKNLSESKYPLVSIAIITYNQKEYLKECIESCLKQDYPNFEIIVADDASTDGTQKMLHEYYNKYPSFFVLKLAAKNQGITANSNIAHFACKGKYIAWMGGDDLMLPGKISKQVEFMESNPGCAICYHNLEIFDSNDGRILRYYNDKLKINGDVKEAIRYGTFNGACSNMVRAEKSPLYGFDESLKVASDWLYWVETLANGGSINYIDEVLGKYRRHRNNVTNSRALITQNELDHLVACQIIIAKYPEHLPHALYAYSKKVESLRYKLPYFHSLFPLLFINPSYKIIIKILVYLLTFTKIKL